MKQFLITVAGVIVGMTTFLFLIFFLPLAIIGGNAEDPARDQIILSLDLRQPLPDQPIDSVFPFDENLSVTTVAQALMHAEADDRVKGLFVRANEFGMTPAQAEEIAAAFRDFQASGKFVIVHSQGFIGTSITAYLAVAGADEVWLQASAPFTASGIIAETPFYGGVFEKYGAEAQFERFEDYKTAVNTYTQTTYTDAHRESLSGLLSSLYEQSLASIAPGRGKPVEDLRALIEAAPHSAEAAVEAGLADRLGHVVEAREAALARTEGAELVAIDDYMELPVATDSRQAGTIALIAGQGTVVTGGSDDGGLFAGAGFGGDTISEAILAAAANDNINAIVFRVDTPGGSAIASDQIWHAIERAKEAGKPVIVSMAGYAASGGYYVSMNADAIVAHPTTITGSIGVFSGKFVFEGTRALVGYNLEPLYAGGDYTLAYTSAHGFTDEQRATLREGLRLTYEDFTTKVAEGRNLPLERVLEIAGGRVWTGAQAQERGLVDELGGLRTAVNTAKRLAGIDEDATVRVRRFPARKNAFEKFQALFGASAEGARAARVMSELATLPEVQAFIRARGDLNERQRVKAPLPDIK